MKSIYVSNTAIHYQLYFFFSSPGSNRTAVPAAMIQPHAECFSVKFHSLVYFKKMKMGTHLYRAGHSINHYYFDGPFVP